MKSADTVTTCPRTWLDRLDALPGRLTIDAAGYPVAVQVPRAELTSVYLPVLSLLHDDLQSGRRVVAGLAGIPGSGKSTFAAVLARLADVLFGIGRLVAVGLDGWHWPNRVLDAKTTTDECGEVVPLRQRKGGPESFDVDSLAAALRELKTGRPVSLPVYDRRLHDPVHAGLPIGPGTAVVLVEGNFVLESNSPWDEVSGQLQPKLFLECDARIARERVISRHIRGGTPADQAEHKFEMNDRLNTTAVLVSAANAEYTIRFAPELAVFRKTPCRG